MTRRSTMVRFSQSAAALLLLLISTTSTTTGFPNPWTTESIHHGGWHDGLQSSKSSSYPHNYCDDHTRTPSHDLWRTAGSTSPFSSLPVVLQLRAGAASLTKRIIPPGRSSSRLPTSQQPQLTDTKAATVQSTSNSESATAASTSMMTFNLVKGILGSGILALPAGIATLTSSNDPNAVLLPAVLLLALTGTVSAYGFTLIGLICDVTGAKTYKEAWNASVGRPTSTTKGNNSITSQTSWMPALACLAVTFCTTLTYTMVLADMIPQLLQPWLQLSRSTTLVGLAAILAPICLLQELKKLAPVSIVGLVGTIYTALAMVFRYYQQSTNISSMTASTITIGKLLNIQRWSLQSPAIFLSMLSTSFMAHYNAPRVYWELRGNTDQKNNSRVQASPNGMSRFVQVVRYGFAAATAVMAMIATSGYAVFGRNSPSNILSAYPPGDALMTLGRAAIAVSLICTFPLAFVGIRNQFMELTGLSSQSEALATTNKTGRNQAVVASSSLSDSVTTVVTFGLLSVLAIVAYFVRDLRIVLAVGGSTWGNAVIYLFPSLMMIHAAQKYPQLQDHVPYAAVTGLMGLLLASMGSRRILALIRS